MSVGVSVALILDFHNPALSSYTGLQRFMIFMFQTVNTRFGGLEPSNSININSIS